MKSIDTYLSAAVAAQASDIHLIGGEFPTMRINGELTPIEEKELTASTLETAVMGLMSSKQKEKFDIEKEADFAYEVDGNRFRMNAHLQQGMIGLAARFIPKDIPSPEVLQFSETISSFANFTDGLVLLVGPTGSGKSTTIASLVEEINKTRKAHIITIEDPVEFVFQNKQSLVEQREVGTDTPTFASALKHVLRQDPDVIVVGEMRDPETIATVLTAAETGHLVFSTLHTSSTAEAVERIVDVFEGPKQRQVLIQLSSVLRGVVAQHLLPGVDGTRVAAREVLVNTPAVSNLIRENNIAQIKSVLQTGARDGQLPMEMAIKQLVKEKQISSEIAELYMSGKNQ
jgi:twitching motility protein PilT